MALLGAKSFTRLTRPRPDGLPNALVLWWFPAVLLVLFVVAVALEVSGTSTGVWAYVFDKHADPDLIAGQPRSIRSDEWLVQGSWLVSQSHQGYPLVNHVFPGGMDATVMNDTPTWDWSSLFRPQLWGSLVLGLDRGMAFRWWIQALLILTTVHAFVVSLLPRQAVLGPVLALALLLQPLVQWWWFPAMTTPIVFAFATMTATIWALRADTLRARAIPAVIAGYLTVTMGMSIYVPFMLACAYPAGAFIVGRLLQAARTDAMPLRELWRRMVPLIASGLTAAAVLVAWAATRRDTVRALLDTVYPGHRLVDTGSSPGSDFITLFSAPFDRALKIPHWGGLGPGESAAATGFAVSLFLLIPLLWIAIVRWRRSGPDWPVLTVLGVQLLVLAIMFVPGWDAIAHLLLADRVPALRWRLTFVVLIPVTIVLLAERLEQHRRPPPLSVALGGSAALGLTTFWVARWIGRESPSVPPWTIAVVATATLVATALALLARRRVTAGAVALLAATILVGWGVNPLYRGVFDASRDTAAGREVVSIHRAHPEATWVGVGGWISMGTLFEAAVPAYSGVQTYPSLVMWDQIDPGRQHESAWNRLGHVHWLPGSGDPDPRHSPADSSDVINVTFDSCAPFAQQYVDYVLADGEPLDQPCLSHVASFHKGMVIENIYRVVKTG